MAEPRLSQAAKGALTLAAVLTLVGVAVPSTAVALTVAPIVGILVLYTMTQVSLRQSMMTLMFFAFVLENPDEVPASGLWKSPFSTVGAIMLTHLNNVDRSITALSWCSFSGMDICLATLVVIALKRRASYSRLEGKGHISSPKPLIQLSFVSVGGIFLVWALGMLQHGTFNMSLWQLNRVMYLPLVYFLFERALRGPRDNWALARVMLAAATFRAVMAIYIYHTVDAPLDPYGNSTLAYATTHADSMLFAIAFVVCLSVLLERVPKALKRRCLLLLPVLSLGIVDNGRRMAWVQVAFVFLTVYPITADNPVKRKIRKLLPFAIAVFAMYAAVGWGSKAAIFKPVAMLKSVVEPSTDASSLWREIENYDIISTFRMNPIFGTGYGHGYAEFISLPAVSYPLERYAPHNSILGLWCYCGYVGYTAITMPWIVGVYFAMRAHKWAKDPLQRVAAVASFGAVLVYLIQCWGDMGLGSWTGVYITAPALAVAGKLAVANGQWGARKRGAHAPGMHQPSASGGAKSEQAA